MATSNWNPGLTTSVSADAPNSTDVDGADYTIGWNVPLFRPYKNPDSTIPSADVWLPGTYVGNGFILTSWHYPLMNTDSYRISFVLKPGYLLNQIKDTYRFFGLSAFAGSLAGVLVTLPTQPTDQYRYLGVVFNSGSLTSTLVSLPTQPTDQYKHLGIVFGAGASLVVMVVSLPTQPTDQYKHKGLTFTGGSLA